MPKILLIKFLVWLRLLPRPQYLSYIVSEHPTPDEIKDGMMLVVKDGTLEKWACFRCPCGCGQRIQLSLSQTRRPRWAVLTDWLSRPTVHPSVRQLSGCKSHFWIKRGKIEWCNDTGR
jgi:hypothetical protein